MEQEDYLERQIGYIGRVLEKILFHLLGFKNRGQINEGIEITNQILKQEIDFDIQDLLDIPTDSFIKTLVSTKSFCNANFEKLAEYFLLIADNTEDNKREMLYEKCLVIFEYLEKAESTYSLDRQWKIEQLKKNKIINNN
jgi:hypothetical protein